MVYVLSMVILYVTECGICVVDGDTSCHIVWYMCSGLWKEADDKGT